MNKEKIVIMQDSINGSISAKFQMKRIWNGSGDPIKNR